MAGQILRHADAWRLVSRDTGEVIVGQFRPTGLEHDLGAKWASIHGVGQQYPILQWTGGEQEVIRFEARVWSHSSADNSHATEIIRQLQAAVKQDPELGRPPIWELHIGSWSAVVVIQSLGGIRYDRVRPESGQIRGALFRLELLRYEEYAVDLRRSQSESLIVPMRSGSSFETLARNAYGDPAAGEALRRRNPELRRPRVGERVHMPPIASLLNGFVRTPQDPALEDSTRADAARRAHYALRSVSLPAYGLGPEWDGA